VLSTSYTLAEENFSMWQMLKATTSIVSGIAGNQFMLWATKEIDAACLFQTSR